MRSDRASATRRCAPPRLHMSYSRIHVSILRMESPRRTLGRRMAVKYIHLALQHLYYVVPCNFSHTPPHLLTACACTSLSTPLCTMGIPCTPLCKEPHTYMHKRTMRIHIYTYIYTQAHHAHPLAHHCAKNQRLRAEPAHQGWVGRGPVFACFHRRLIG